MPPFAVVGQQSRVCNVIVASLQLENPLPVTTQLRPFSDPHLCVPEAEYPCNCASFSAGFNADFNSGFSSWPPADTLASMAMATRHGMARKPGRTGSLVDFSMVFLVPTPDKRRAPESSL
jgi:hypothetical protein